jgi:nucleoside-diphosphate-sugar epimerase
VSHYGRSKRAGEIAALAWARHVPISIVRPAIVFGPRDEALLPIFRTIASTGTHIVPGFVPRRVGLIYQQDLTVLLRCVAERGRRLTSDHAEAARQVAEPSTGIYFAADTEFPSFSQLGRMVALALDRPRVLVLPIAEPFAWLAAGGNQSWRWLRGHSDTFNIDKMREAFAGDWMADVGRLRDELAFQPGAPLQERLQQTADWYRREGWLRSPREHGIRGD